MRPTYRIPFWFDAQGKFSAPSSYYCLFMLALVISLLTIQCSPAVLLHQKNKPQALLERKDWPHTGSEISPDPDIRFGQFDNGFRYLLKPNAMPRDRVSMHLYIQTGSLNETDQEQGIAHFLEHMVFNGSTHFAPGEMVKFFQRIGMQFGPDANAHTGFAQTVFDVLLPKGDPKNISEGLMVLRDYAEGALLPPEEVDRERKVVLAEMRSRDSAEFRMLKSAFQFEMPETILADHFPIGKEEVLRKIDAAMLRSYYDAWYRPERMTLVMVGDFSPREVIPLITGEFSGMKARGAERTLPDFGGFHHSGIQPYYHYESKTGATTIRLETIEQHPQPQDSMAYRNRMLHRDLSEMMFQNRLDELLQKPDSVFTSAAIGLGYYLQQIHYAEISADCKPQNWDQALSVLEKELRKALRYGFLSNELIRAKMDYLAQLQRKVRESDTQESSQLARWIISQLNRWEVIQSPRQTLDLMEPLMAATTLEDVNQAFRLAWKADHRLILVSGNADLTSQAGSPEEQILQAYHDSSMSAVSAPADLKAAQFPYLPKPQTPGTIASRQLLAEGVEKVVFENGIQLLMKTTRFKQNQVMAALSFGGGKASEPITQPGLAEITEGVVNASGFGKMDLNTLERALAGKLARVSLEIREDLFVVKGDSITAELPTLVQLLYTFTNDPGYRPEALQLTRKRYEQHLRSMDCNVEGVMQSRGRQFLAGGDSRFGLPHWTEFKKRSLEEVEAWFGRQLTQEPMELALVGDFNPEVAVKLVAGYLGAMPPRQGEGQRVTRARPTFPAGRKISLKADSVIPNSLVVVAFPTDDFWNIRRTRRMNVLSEVFNERLRERIREKLGAAYSPFAYNLPYRGYPGYGLFQVYLNVEPKLAPDLIEEVYKIARQIKKNGIDEDEFRRALDPTLTRIKDLRQENSYWMNSVLLAAGRYPQQLEWCRTIEKDYTAITADEITDLARRYLDESKAAAIVILPKSGES